MPSGITYTVTEGWDDVSVAIKGAPISDARKIRAADRVSSRIWIEKPWYDSITTIASGTIACIDGVQDYSPPANIYRLTKVSIVRTDVSPNEVRDLDVCQNLDVSLRKQAYTTIRSAALQPGVGQIRLEAAIQVTSPTTLEIRGEIQPNHTKITALTNTLWFRDAQLFDCFVEGLTYWGYKYVDDPRAGGVVYSEGNASYTGQLGAFMSSLRAAAKSEDFSGEDSLFPRDTIAPWRDSGSGLSIFNW